MEDIVQEVESWILQYKRKTGKYRVKLKVLRSYLKDGKPFECCYCKTSLTLKKVTLKKDCHVLPENYLTVEHIKPMSSFFNDVFDRLKVRQWLSHPCNRVENLALSCYKCNNSLGHHGKTVK